MIHLLIYFYNQLDILNLVMNELDDLVDRFIIVEYPYGYDRSFRKMYFNENKDNDRFKKFKNKITHVIDNYHYNNKFGLGLLWSRKNSPLLMESLKGCKDDDFVITLDDDVVIKRSIFDNFDFKKPTTLHMRWCMYWFNYYTTNLSFAWSVACPYSIVKEVTLSKLVGWQPPPEIGVQVIPDAGWHFTKCGGVDRILESIKGYPHQEYNNPKLLDPILLKEKIENGWGWNDDTKGQATKGWSFFYDDYVPENYPKYMNDHPEIYKNYFCFTKGAKNLGLKNWE